MSLHRRNPNAGYCNPSKLTKGPNGRALCRHCATEVPPGRRTFCNDACVDQWKLRSNPGYARQKVFERDHGVCAVCNVDTCAEWRSRRSERGQRWAGGTGNLWQADHIVPVSEGGGSCGLENLRTLCTACHRAMTAELAKRRAERARRAKLERALAGE